MLSQAVEYFQRVLSLQQDNGEIWSALGSSDPSYIQPVAHNPLGHCYLMQDDLQKAYSAYQHALYSLPNPKVFVNHAYVVRESCLMLNRKTRNCGMGSESFTTGMGPWTMQKKPSRRS